MENSEKMSSSVLFDAVFSKAVAEDFEDELINIPSFEELEKLHTFSEHHVKRMEKLFREEKRNNRIKHALRWSRSVVAAITISITVLFTVLMFSASVRAAVGEIFEEWFEKFTKFALSSQATIETSEMMWELSYLPEGFDDYEITSQGDINEIVYQNSLNEEITFTFVIGIDSISVNNERIEYSSTIYNSVVYHIFESRDIGTSSSIVWNKDGYSFLINAEYSIQELLKIAQSVSKSELR